MYRCIMYLRYVYIYYVYTYLWTYVYLHIQMNRINHGFRTYRLRFCAGPIKQRRFQKSRESSRLISAKSRRSLFQKNSPRGSVQDEKPIISDDSFDSFDSMEEQNELLFFGEALSPTHNISIVEIPIFNRPYHNTSILVQKNERHETRTT